MNSNNQTSLGEWRYRLGGVLKSHFDNDCIGSRFGVPDAPALTTVPLKAAQFNVTKLHRKLGRDEMPKIDIPASDAYFMMLYLADTVHGDVENGERFLAPKLYPQNTVCLIDIKQGASIVLHSNLHALAFVLPRTLFAETSALTASDGARDLRCRRGEADEVIANLGTALLPLFDYANTFHPALLQHIATALCAHLLHEGAKPELAAISEEIGLSIWQETSAKKFMSENYGEDISVTEIAASIGVPVGEFSIRFRNCTGIGPEAWLMAIRLEHAKLLLKDGSLTIKQVASRCGFSSESALASRFVDTTGVSPGLWRKSVYH